MARAVVIGAGFGGLALAIRLQAAGVDTQLIEKRDKPGGRAYVFEQDGYRFDAGPTVITDPTALADLFALAGQDMASHVDLRPIEPFYRLLWEDGTRFDYTNSQAELDRQIATLSPPDVAGYRRFLEYSTAVFEEGYVKLGHVPFLKLESMLRAAPALLKLQAWRSVYSKVADYVAEPHLRQALSFHTLLVGGSPFRSSSIYALIHALERKWGVWYATGGTGAIVAALANLFVSLGGTLRTGTTVDSIEVRDGRTTGVRLSDGEVIAADVVASNGDVVHTYETLLRATSRGVKMGRKLRRQRHSPSLFVVYFGLARPAADLAHHTILFGESYKGLIDDIYDARPLRPDFSLYLHSPSVTDASVAPSGCSTYYALAPVPNLKRAVDWRIEGPRYADSILASLERRVLPGLRADLRTLRTFTPLDFRTELNAHLGAAFSLEPILTQSAWFRVHNRDAEIRNLYFVGAGTHPGAGVPGVVASARATASTILQDLEHRRPA